MNLKKLTNEYLNNFQKKDINELNKIFHKNIELLDVNKTIMGKKKVLSFNKKFFKKYKLIKIKILKQSFNHVENISFSYISIMLNKKIYHVVDLVEFSKYKKIKKISAFINNK